MAFMVVIEGDGQIETMPRGNIVSQRRHGVMAVRRGRGIALMTLENAKTALTAGSNAVQAAHQSILCPTVKGKCVSGPARENQSEATSSIRISKSLDARILSSSMISQRSANFVADSCCNTSIRFGRKMFCFFHYYLE
jgi:hypothetical protein